jgi:aryl-alcohol dehydrogenase-like predicted oxidoreductase
VARDGDAHWSDQLAQAQAAEIGATPAAVALAWVLSRRG